MAQTPTGARAIFFYKELLCQGPEDASNHHIIISSIIIIITIGIWGKITWLTLSLLKY